MTTARARWFGVPVEPDAEEARRWAEEELSRSVYSTEPGLLQRLWNWFLEQLQRLLELEASAPPNLVPLIVVVGTVVLLAVALYLAGPVRTRRRRTGSGSSAVFEDDDATSAELTAAADAAADRADWPLAVLMRFRAVIRSLDERTVLEDRPGLTAHEASTAAARRLPDHATGLVRAGQLFDDVYYGSARPDAQDDARLRELAASVARSRPLNPATAASTTWAELR